MESGRKDKEKGRKKMEDRKNGKTKEGRTKKEEQKEGRLQRKNEQKVGRRKIIKDGRKEKGGRITER